MITDRRRLGPGWEAALVERVAAAACAGIDLIQIRERDLDGRLLATLVERCVQAVRSTRARILVNDRADIALTAGAHGVHLRGDSMPAPRVRRIAPAGFLMGRSVHSAEEAACAWREGGLDYLIFGPVFPTASKPALSPAGADALAQVVAATPLPVLAVGGMSVARLHEVVRAGAAGIAAIGVFAESSVERLPGTILSLAGSWKARPGLRT